MPDLVHLAAVTDELQRRGVPYALGGSGLLHSLGLTDTVRDWDLTTEAPKEQVWEALRHLELQEGKSGDYPFGSAYKLVIHQEDPQVEILGRFSIHTGKGLCRLPTVPASVWNGVHVGSPEVWYAAYALMNRQDKADLLYSYLKEKGADRRVIQNLTREPLPDDVRERLVSLA